MFPIAFAIYLFIYIFFPVAVNVSTLVSWLISLLCRCCRTVPKPGARWNCTGERHPALTSCVSSMYTRTYTKAASAYSSSWSGESYVCNSHACVSIAMSGCAQDVHPPQAKTCSCESTQYWHLIFECILDWHNIDLDSAWPFPCVHSILALYGASHLHVPPASYSKQWSNFSIIESFGYLLINPEPTHLWCHVAVRGFHCAVCVKRVLAGVANTSL